MGSKGQDGERSPGGAPVAERLTRLFAELYVRSGAEQYGLEAGHFLRILAEVGARYLTAGAGEKEAVEFYGSLRVEELALARACAAGNERAWEIFLTRYREKLYDAARGITREDASGHELADSLYADLYASGTKGGERVSKLASYTGRGSLEGWLRTVLAQEHVNRYRKSKRLVSLEEQQEQGAQFEAPAAAAQAADPDPRIAAATDEALASLDAEERFILAAYFLDGRTLAEVGRMLGVHESTISRRVEKLANTLRKRIVDELGKRGMSRRQAEEALDADVRDLAVDVRRHLAQETPAETFSLRKERE